MNLIIRGADAYFNLHSTVVGGMIGELWGTFILLVFGLGVILQVELSNGAHGSFLSISLGWGFAVMMAVFWSGKLGHGHANPAVTLAFAAIGRLEWKRVPCYWISQLLGAFLGALVLFLIYYEKILEFAAVKDNGKLLVQSTGAFFITSRSTGLITAFFDQLFGTFLLTSCAIAITDVEGFDLPDYLHPLMLGFMVSGIVGCFAMNAGAALNPARDLGPRIMIALCGWGKEAFTTLNYYFWVPIIAPLCGGVIGALFYEVCIGVHLHSKKRVI